MVGGLKCICGLKVCGLLQENRVG